MSQDQPCPGPGKSEILFDQMAGGQPGAGAQRPPRLVPVRMPHALKDRPIRTEGIAHGGKRAASIGSSTKTFSLILRLLSRDAPEGGGGVR